MSYESLYTTLVLEDILLSRALIQQPYAHPRIEKRQLPQPAREDVVMELDIAKGGWARAKENLRTGGSRFADHGKRSLRLSVAVDLSMRFEQ